MVEESQEVQWNLSQYKISLIGNYLVKGMFYFNKNQPIKWLKSLQSIAMLISNRLKEDESGELMKLEKKIIKECISRNTNNGYTKGSQSYLDNRFVVDKVKMIPLVRQYSNLINEYLKKYGFDIKEKGQSSLF